MKKFIILLPLFLITTQETSCSSDQKSKKPSDIIKIAAAEKAPSSNSSDYSNIYHEWPGSSAPVYSLQEIKKQDPLPTPPSYDEFP